jgi:hypothetical protein
MPLCRATSRHRAGVGIGQRNLTIRRFNEGFSHRLQACDLLPDAAVTTGKMGHLLGAGLASFLLIDPHHDVDIAGNIGLERSKAAGDLVLGEVLVVRPSLEPMAFGPHCSPP